MRYVIVMDSRRPKISVVRIKMRGIFLNWRHRIGGRVSNGRMIPWLAYYITADSAKQVRQKLKENPNISIDEIYHLVKFD